MNCPLPGINNACAEQCRYSMDEFCYARWIKRFTGEYAWLSNFYPAEVELDLVNYPTVENAFQAAKCINREDRMQFVNITPGQAKRLGRKIKLRGNWEEMNLDVMEMLVGRKFRIPELRAKLIATGETMLMEGNDWGDRFWGVCDGQGQNHLGQILMLVRIVCKHEAGHGSPIGE